jgi:hypothetical protein
VSVGIFRQGFLWILDNARANDPIQSDHTYITFPFGGIAGDLPVVGNWYYWTGPSTYTSQQNKTMTRNNVTTQINSGPYYVYNDGMPVVFSQFGTCANGSDCTTPAVG